MTKQKTPRLNPSERELIRLMYINGERLWQRGEKWTRGSADVSSALGNAVFRKGLLSEAGGFAHDKGSYLLSDLGRRIGRKAQETFDAKHAR